VDTLSFVETVQTRRSIRAFSSTPLSGEVIRSVLGDAQRAPSNCNTQPWIVHIASGDAIEALSRALHAASAGGRLSPDFSWDESAFTGVYGDRRRTQGKLYYENLGVTRDDTEERRRASAANFSFFGAPHVAFLFMPVVGDCVRVAGDIGMYAQTFLLALAARGLGGVPQTVLGLYADTVRECLGIEANQKLLFGVSFGYLDVAAPANRLRMDRDELTQSVTFHG
jgi:nitroreductase